MAQNIKALITEAASELELEVWDIAWEQASGSKVLRVFVDKEQGVSINECVALNKVLCERIDEEQIKGEYQLEVSSPGVERKLHNYDQIKRNLGKDVYLKLYEKLEGRKELIGKLIGVTEHPLGYVVTIDDGTKRLELHSETIATIKIHLKG